MSAMDRAFQNGGVVEAGLKLFLSDAPGMTPELLRKFSEAAGSHTKKWLGFANIPLRFMCLHRFELLKVFLLSDELRGSQSQCVLDLSFVRKDKTLTASVTQPLGFLFSMLC